MINDTLRYLKIEDLSINSKHVRPNTLFIAISGANADGHDFIEEAIRNGATAIVGEKDINELAIQSLEDEKYAEGMVENRELSIPYIQVENSRKALANIASQFYGNSIKN